MDDLENVKKAQDIAFSYCNTNRYGSDSNIRFALAILANFAEDTIFDKKDTDKLFTDAVALKADNASLHRQLNSITQGQIRNEDKIMNLTSEIMRLEDALDKSEGNIL